MMRLSAWLINRTAAAVRFFYSSLRPAGVKTTFIRYNCQFSITEFIKAYNVCFSVLAAKIFIHYIDKRIILNHIFFQKGVLP